MKNARQVGNSDQANGNKIKPARSKHIPRGKMRVVDYRNEGREMFWDGVGKKWYSIVERS